LLCTGLWGIWLTSKRSWIADFAAARRKFYRLLYLLTAFLSLCTGLRGILLTSKRPGFALIVAVRSVPGNFVYFETTWICINCRCTQCSGEFGLLRNDLGLHMLSLCTGFRGMCLALKQIRTDLGLLICFSLYAGFPRILFTSKRPWIADFVAVHGTPGHFAYFETTLACTFCRYTQGSRAFGLLRNDLGLQILSLYMGRWGICVTLKRPWIADFVAV
jgi:hypothetical protein